MSDTIKLNEFFGGAVKSLGFERNGRRTTAGVMAAGEYHFDTGVAERMTVTSGQMEARIAGGAWVVYPCGTAFEVPAHTGFDVRLAQVAAYICEFLG